MTIRAPSDEFIPSTGAPSPAPRSSGSSMPLAPGRTSDRAIAPGTPSTSGDREEQQRRRGEEQTQRQTVSGLQAIMARDDFLPNALTGVHQSSYRFKLFMTDERDLFVGARVGSLQNLYEKLDSMPQAIIAETGVTSGFNISSVTMEEIVSPGFQNRNTGLTTMKISISEPGGSSLMETIAKSAQRLGISNYQNYWYFLELSFHGYDEDGSVLTNTLASADLPSGGRWIYQINITNCEVKMNEMGATYDLTCRPMTMNAFESTMVGTVPDNISVAGGTIGEFLDNFATELTNKYDERYAGRIFNFKFKNRPLKGSSAAIDPNAFRLKQTENDPINTLPMHIAESSTGGVAAQIPMGTRINDVIDFIWASCEDAQKLMLDTKSPDKVQDDDGKFNGKSYRESVVPRVEADVSVTGYDPITNCYMQDITYNIYGYYTYAPNLCPVQATNAENEAENVGGKIAQQLVDKGYLRKKYDYRYTGLNTEVIRFDLDFNFAFSSVLPRLAGWRADLASVTDAERKAIEQGEIKGTTPTEISANGTNAVGRPVETIRPDPTFSEQDASRVNDNRALLVETLDELIKKRADEVAGANDPATVRQYDQAIAAARRAQSVNRQEAAMIRNDYLRMREESAAEAAKLGTFYAEDQVNVIPNAAYKIRYRQASDDITNQAGGSGVLGQWHRGGSLTGALLNQLYEPVVTSLVRIDLEIRGDPYWLGLSNLERRAIMNDVLPADQAYAKLPNFSEGDNTFALTLRFPSTIDEDGNPRFRKDDVFNGLYRCNRITHNFVDGAYTQKITATKLELAMLPASAITENDVVITRA